MRKEVIQIRVSDQEKQQIEANAKIANMKTSEWLRSLALKPGQRPSGDAARQAKAQQAIDAELRIRRPQPATYESPAQRKARLSSKKR